MRRLLLVLSAAAVVFGMAAPAASAQTTPDAVTVARGLIAAENANNVAAAVAFFAPGAIVNLPTGVFVGHDQITEWQSELAAGHFHANTTAPVAVTPEVVTFTGSVSLDLFRSLGIASLDSTWQLTIQLGKITTFTFDFTPAATAQLNAAWAGAGAGAGAGSGGGAAASTATTVRAATAAGGGTTAQAAPATATSRSLALTGADLRPAAAGGVAIVLGLVLVGAGRRRARSLT